MKAFFNPFPLVPTFILSLLLSSVVLEAEAQILRPNVVLIITDDVGYADIGSYGASDIRTPNLDSLARDGVRLTDFYANSPLCSPTRAALLTGRYQQRYAVESSLSHFGAQPEQGLPASGTSLPQLLKDNDYATALIGKWHLGYRAEFSPAAHGYDYFFGFKSGYIDYYQHTDGGGNPDLFENALPIEQEGYMTDLITERSVEFIQQHAQQQFFIEVAYNAAHWPYQVPDNPSVAIDRARHLQPGDDPGSTREDYVAIMERADQGIGEILDTLERLNLEENTLVIFTNDNGGEWLSDNSPLFHRKWTLWEGGIRVPTILRWPGIIPAGTISNQVGITMDLGATILSATNTPVPSHANLDGINILPMVSGDTLVQERTLFWRTRAGDQYQWAIRNGDWKLLIDAGATLLFNVRNDLGERFDLAGQRQDIVKRLRPLLVNWDAEVTAEARDNGSYEFN